MFVDLFLPVLLSNRSVSLSLFFFLLFTGANWNGVALDEFAGCESNLAANRQTRMLADLALVGCYNKTYMPTAERDRIMLASAKRNLAAMSYFGLTEYQKISQYIFEETFNLRFAIPFEQHNTTVSTVTMNSLTPAQRARIDQLNALDLELYAFAKKLMFQRYYTTLHCLHLGPCTGKTTNTGFTEKERKNRAKKAGRRKYRAQFSSVWQVGTSGLEAVYYRNTKYGQSRAAACPLALAVLATAPPGLADVDIVRAELSHTRPISSGQILDTLSFSSLYFFR